MAAVSIVERVETTREEVVEKKMLTEVTRMTRARKAVRMGLIVTSWAFRNLSTTMGHSTGLIREQCPVW